MNLSDTEKERYLDILSFIGVFLLIWLYIYENDNQAIYIY